MKLFHVFSHFFWVEAPSALSAPRAQGNRGASLPS